MKIKFKIWIETDDGKPILGKGGVKLLENIKSTGSIAEAAKNVNVSYKFAWEYVKKIEGLLGGIETKKGGKGAGGTMLSEKLDKIIEIYQSAEKEIEEVLKKYEEKLKDVTTNT
jgi:molybdate transport system regulatory protein